MKTRSGRSSASRCDQIAEVVAHAHEKDLVAALAQGVRDLVFHLGLVDVPAGHLRLHLALVLRVFPAGVGSVENDDDPHAA